MTLTILYNYITILWFCFMLTLKKNRNHIIIVLIIPQRPEILLFGFFNRRAQRLSLQRVLRVLSYNMH